MKIQLLTLICAAFGLSLPEIPNLPDLVGIVDNAVHLNFTVQTVEEPQAFLPTIAEITAMTDQEKNWTPSLVSLCFSPGVSFYCYLRDRHHGRRSWAKSTRLLPWARPDCRSERQGSIVVGHIELWRYGVFELRCMYVELRNWTPVQDTELGLGSLFVSVLLCWCLPDRPSCAGGGEAQSGWPLWCHSFCHGFIFLHGTVFVWPVRYFKRYHFWMALLAVKAPFHEDRRSVELVVPTSLPCLVFLCSTCSWRTGCKLF